MMIICAAQHRFLEATIIYVDESRSDDKFFNSCYASIILTFFFMLTDYLGCQERIKCNTSFSQS